MVLNVIFNYISVIIVGSVLLVEETRIPRENHKPVASHRQYLSHNVISLCNYHYVSIMYINKIKLPYDNDHKGFQHVNNKDTKREVMDHSI